jgi:hypothetical protein
VATLVLIVLALVVFSRGLQGLAVDVAVFDAAVVGWLGGVDLPGFQGLMRGLGAISTWWVLNGLLYGLIVLLLVLRRFRHLIIWLVLGNVLAVIGGSIVAPVTQRPRPFGVEIRERPPGRRRGPRPGHPPRPGGPARADRHRSQAVRPVEVGRLDAAADHRRRRPAGAAVRQAVRPEPPALGPLVQAGPGAAVRPDPVRVVELTPEREYLLVTEFFAGATELGEADVDDQVIDDGLGIIRKLCDAGLAHRDIKPANLLVRDGRMLLIDVAFVQARPSPWRQAVDLANMMLCLALRSSPQRVYERALRQFSVEEITEGFAAARGLALPSQLRRMLRAQGRDRRRCCRVCAPCRWGGRWATWPSTTATAAR